MSYDIERAKRFLDYENTALDTTPGGEQFINMLDSWEEWEKFFLDYQDKIIYGSDYYAFLKDENWQENFLRRPNFLRQFFETDTEHDYLGEVFHGVNMDREILGKIYFKNALKRFGEPKRIDDDYIIKRAQTLLNVKEKHAEFADVDLNYILQTVKT